MKEKNLKRKLSELENIARLSEDFYKYPQLMYLFVELTDRCNLSCLHCGSRCGSAGGRNIDTELLLRSLRELAEDTDPREIMLCITGGEPMLHPDFMRILKEGADIGYPTGITTNGSLITERAAEEMARAGLRSISLSLDGLEVTHNAFRRAKGNSFRDTLTALGRLRAVGIEAQITTVAHRASLPELEDIYRLMLELGVYSWRVINVDPIGRANENPDIMLTPDELISLVDYIAEKRREAKGIMDVRYGCSHYLGVEREMTVREHYFLCAAGTRVMGITASGDIVTCLDIERRPELTYGNIARDRLYRVWQEGFGFFRRDRTADSQVCRDCPDRRFCRGDSAHTWDYDRSEPLLCIRKCKKG